MGAVRQVLRHLMTRVLPRCLFLVRGNPRSNAVALTFDDGPHPQHTPAILDRLKALGIPATFFLVGERAQRHPELVRRIIAEGHEIGHHSFTHGVPEETSPQVLAKEIGTTEHLFRSLGVGDSRLVRPPHGKVTAAKLVVIWWLGKVIVLWNVDPKDYNLPSTESLARWALSWHPSGGDIVLLHDNHPRAVAILDALADRVWSVGLSFRTITGLLDHAA